MSKSDKVRQKVVEYVGGFWFFLALISVIVLTVLNCTSIYGIMIDKYGLTSITGLSKEILMINYQEMVSYLQYFGPGYLTLSNFEMSENGMIHFADVKVIFQWLYVIVILFIIAFVILLIIKYQDKTCGKTILTIFNKGANLAFIVFGLLIISISYNFSATFTMFHKIFFRNDYWIFDYRTDPVILALPEELFLTLSILIIGILFVICIFIKVLYYKQSKFKSLRC